MRRRRTLAFIAALIGACVGGPALAAVAAHPARTPVAQQAAASTTLTTIGAPPLTATLDGTTTTATSTTSTTTTTTTTTPTLLVCTGAELRTLGRALGVRAGTIHERQFLASNGMPQCNYLIARAHRGGPQDKVVVTVNVDNGPQPHWRLMRKVVEAGQLFGPAPPGWRPPVGVRGLGAYASWFPNLDQLMATNIGHVYLVTVGAIWHHATKAELRGLATKAILVYRRIVALPAA